MDDMEQALVRAEDMRAVQYQYFVPDPENLTHSGVVEENTPLASLAARARDSLVDPLHEDETFRFRVEGSRGWRYVNVKVILRSNLEKEMPDATALIELVRADSDILGVVRNKMGSLFPFRKGDVLLCIPPKIAARK